MSNFFKIIGSLVLALVLSSPVSAQVVLQAGQAYGNPGSSQAFAQGTTVGALIDREYTCTAQGSLLYRGSSGWVCLAPGTSGLPLLSQGASANLQYAQVPNSGLVNPSMTISGTSCTLGSSCSPPSSSLVVGSTTITSGTSNGLLYDSAGTLGNLATANGGILNTGATGIPSVTPTPVLGVAGTTAGSLGFQNATSGIVTLTVVTGALGTVTASLPANTGTIAEINLAQTWSAVQSFNSSDLVLKGSSSGTTVLNANAAAGSTTATLPANTGTIAELNFAQTWTATQTFAGITVTTLNGNTFTTGTYTLTGAAGKTLTFNNSLTLTGTDSTTMTFPSTSATITQTVASGATALGTGAISSGTCATVVTATATGTLTTDVLSASFNSDPTAVTGYVPSTSGMLAIIAYPTANTANFKVCNNTLNSITPGAVTLNWRVTR